MADFDDDGLDDIAYTAPSNVITIVVLLNDGAGEFAPSDKYWKQIEGTPVPSGVGRRILWTAELVPHDERVDDRLRVAPDHSSVVTRWIRSSRYVLRIPAFAHSPST